MSSGFALITPGGKIVAETFRAEKEYAEGAAFDHLHARYKWPEQYWKRWDEFCKERERRGWYVFPVKLKLS